MKPSKVHTCVFQEQVAMGKQEPNVAKKCRCQQVIDYKEANDRVKWGEALWVVSKRERGTEPRTCDLCHGKDDSVSKTCAKCGGTGKMNVAVEWDTYNGDIVLVNHRTKTNRISTPKVPTIESEHILRFIVFEGEDNKIAKEAKERIEEYGRMIQWSLQELGAELRDKKTKEVLIPGKPEPENNRKKGEGRDYDWGRAI